MISNQIMAKLLVVGSIFRELDRLRIYRRLYQVNWVFDWFVLAVILVGALGEGGGCTAVRM